ncbi:TetR/AcrR family transcriptional regulator [Acetobacter sp.]|jgi:AcrR family transcriptional regulator|uniref:TetR/AcrR family transcriptional regulator n=1 Tax=Acetobacter sp. TaxID=440 RepID=UPI0025BB6D89|nr:TetR/AcrR family transcriptional regulator [Acetobacter sp.]MCH4091625.1 TetR/AcrR family transcriptional regulator [Acetobacter sp.]MCI1301189.1 TetR/AcrR family transcriptional regulator [Acetobacter sp.]MCI1317407.1 TetR/AcrR family transcriptional regulator [Acetobacter sp.]
MISHSRKGPRPKAADKIRDAAQELFYAQGIRTVGVDEIVQKAGVTKPSLYRLFDSKDGLAATYLADYQQCFWDRIAEVCVIHPDDSRAQLLAYFDGLSERASHPDYRGCGVSNAIAEFPDQNHPVRQAAAALKQEVREWMVRKADVIGARNPALLADGLILLMEGAYACGQSFPSPGPAAAVGQMARLLIEQHCAPAASLPPTSTSLTGNRV